MRGMSIIPKWWTKIKDMSQKIEANTTALKIMNKLEKIETTKLLDPPMSSFEELV
jgi:hypothetical protein